MSPLNQQKKWHQFLISGLKYVCLLCFQLQPLWTRPEYRNEVVFLNSDADSVLLC